MKRERFGESKSDVRAAIEAICRREVHSNECEGLTLTPLEKQVAQMKLALPSHVILLVACGYRVKVYGRDSRVVSRRMAIMCIPGVPFEYSSFPYTRIDLYVQRLVAMGYHVAFADQESSAVRAADGIRSGIFTREITQLYSRGTLLPNETVISGGGGDHHASPNANSNGEEIAEEGDEGLMDDNLGMIEKMDHSDLFLCFIYVPTIVPSKEESTPSVLLILVSFVTRQIERITIHTALELEDAVQLHSICELILIVDASLEVNGKRLGVSSCAMDYYKAIPSDFASIFNDVLPLNFGPTPHGEEDGRTVPVCGIVRSKDEALDATIARHLMPYKLHTVYYELLANQPPCATKESIVKKLYLPGSTLRALDIFYSSAGHKGSLFSLLNHTFTPCGSRRLRSWLAAPLASYQAIQDRQDAIRSLMLREESGLIVEFLRESSKIGDIEALIGKIFARRCSVSEYIRLLRILISANNYAEQIRAQPCCSGLLMQAAEGLVSEEALSFIERRRSEARSHATTAAEFFAEDGMDVPDALQKHSREKKDALDALQTELERIQKVLGMPSLEYKSIAGTNFIIDVPTSKCSKIPKDWLVLTRTKMSVRYHTQEIVDQNIALCAASERLASAANDAWIQRQEELSKSDADMKIFRTLLDSIATFDALHSLSLASRSAGYVAPTLLEQNDATTMASDARGPFLQIREGRHPVLDRLTGGDYVACDIDLQKGSSWLLTGPNMGGKSALMRMIGSFIVLSQIGCFVPASAAKIPLFEALYCRMGASDSILEGSSTFLGEMEETSRILRSPHLSSSLVLMDELGRGTSSFDGMAVASATLEYLIRQRSTTIFVTHYTSICDKYLNHSHPSVECYFMGFLEEKVPSSTGGSDSHERRIVFTYKPCKGVTPSSFGVEVARMAGLPSSVLENAKQISFKQEQIQSTRIGLNKIEKFVISSN